MGRLPNTSLTAALLSAKLSRMHAVALTAIRTAQRPISRRACRIVAGCRHPLSHRSFHRSRILCQIPEDPAAPGTGGKAENSPENVEPEAEVLDDSVSLSTLAKDTPFYS